jgi:hypothetical protein
MIMLHPVLTNNSQGFALTLDFLRRRIHHQIEQFTVQTIKQSGTPAMIYRVGLQPNLNGGRPHSASLKVIAPEWPGDLHGPDRELNFYTQIRPRLDFDHPQLYDAGLDPASQCRYILMEDITPKYLFHSPTHLWTPAEATIVLRSYAHLHVAGRSAVPAESERAWLWSYHRPTWDSQRLVEMDRYLADQGVWRRLPGLTCLAERTLADDGRMQPAGITITHHDVFPPNVALPRLADSRWGAIVDWEMAGWGMAELDLAYFFLQPFRASRLLRRREAVDIYWAERGRLEGVTPPAAERAARQRYADALLALSLLPVAYRSVSQPWPPGSFPRLYWDSMLPILHQRLQELQD